MGTIWLSLCYLILVGLGLAAGGVLHHREHAALHQGKRPVQSSESRRPYGGGSGHGLNYVGAYDATRPGEEKLRVIKITRTYAIPYPVTVPFAKQVPVQKAVQYPVPHALPVAVQKPVYVPNAVLFAGNALKTHSGSIGHSYAVHQNLDYDTPHQLHGHSHQGSYAQPLFAPAGSNSHNFDQQYAQGDFGHSNSLDHSLGHTFYNGLAFKPQFHQIPSGNQLYGAGSSHGHADQGLAGYKPFKPSPEYTPPELNEPRHFSHNDW